MYEALFERIKSTDFPIECRAAYYFAKGRHAHQERKGSGLPYFIHPRGVAYIVMEHGGSLEQINAALCHDLLEDTETSYLEIAEVCGKSFHTADLCSELRNNKYKIQELGKDEYMSEKLINMSKDALLVKLADMFYNINDRPVDKAYQRMLKNTYDVIINRNDVDENIIDLAYKVFVS